MLNVHNLLNVENVLDLYDFYYSITFDIYNAKHGELVSENLFLVLESIMLYDFVPLCTGSHC